MLFHPDSTTHSSNCGQTSTSKSSAPSNPFQGPSVTLIDSYAMFAGGSSGSSVVGGGVGLSTPLSSNMIVSPSPTRTAIKEANDHLQLLHQRVQELERTVREQAEALIKKDECMQTRLRELTQSKDARIAELSRLCDHSGEQIQRLEQACRDRDAQMEEASRRNAEELGSYVPVLERLVTSLRRSSSSPSGRSWMTNHAVCNHAPDLDQTPVGSNNDQHFLPGSRVASPSAVKPLGYVTSSVPTNHRARKMLKGPANNAVRHDFRFHPNSVDSGGDRPTSSSSVGQPPDMRIGRSFNINSNFSMSEDDDYDVNVEDNAHKY